MSVSESVCWCSCGCRRRPGSRNIQCPLCTKPVGPGCCWNESDECCHRCHELFQCHELLQGFHRNVDRYVPACVECDAPITGAVHEVQRMYVFRNRCAMQKKSMCSSCKDELFLEDCNDLPSERSIGPRQQRGRMQDDREQRERRRSRSRDDPRTSNANSSSADRSR